MKFFLIVLLACVCLSQATFRRNQSDIVNTRSLKLKKLQTKTETGEGPNLKIVGGQVTDISKVPWQVSVVRANGIHDCGGSIISKLYVLSAAHCWNTVSDLPAILRAGANDLKIPDSEFLGFETNVVTVTMHPFYEKFFKNDFDVALIKVDTPFQFSNKIAAITLPSAGEWTTDGTNCVVSGWGYTSEGGVMSPTLLSAVVPIVTTAICLRTYGGRSSFTERMLCAGFKEGGVDACQFDSGGPLACNKKLVGVVSFGAGCAKPDAYGVYADVSNSEIRNWIKEVTGV